VSSERFYLFEFISSNHTADDFTARSPDELTLKRGERVELIERDDEFGDGWFLGYHARTEESGLFPEGLCPAQNCNVGHVS
jgi:hypothetical protein